jgi:PAT family beta-lactamase induction signal transducer AmpG
MVMPITSSTSGYANPRVTGDAWTRAASVSTSRPRVKTPAKLGLLASLYLSQGLPYGFFTQALPVLMRKQGLGLPDIGLANLLALPWALKFLWAPLVDRWGSPASGRRRSWIVPLQGASVVTAAALSFVDPRTGVRAMMAALLLTNLIAATQDIATDGLAVELLAEGERGYGNSVQVAGYRVGMILGGGFLLVVFDRLGGSLTFVAMAALLALATLPIVFHRERPPLTAPAGEGGEALRLGAWLAAARRPGWGVWLAILVLYKGGEALAYAMVKPLLVDRGLSVEDIGWLIGTAGFFAGLVGALLGGVLVNRSAAAGAGRARALVVAGALQVAGILAYVAPAAGLGGWWALAAASMLEHLTGGIATVTLFTVMMDVCGEAAATDYTLQASVVVVATGGAATVSGFVAAHLGYPLHFAVSAALSAAGLAFTWRALARGIAPPEAPAPHRAPRVTVPGASGA